jgi:hypothetical protein
VVLREPPLRGFESLFDACREGVVKDSLRGSRPRLPLGDGRSNAVNVDVLGRHRIPASLRYERPVRPNGVGEIPVLSQASARFCGGRTNVPVDLLVLEGLMQPLQEPKLRRGAVLDANVVELPQGEALEVLGDEARAVIGDEGWHCAQGAVDSFRFLAGEIERCGDVRAAVAGGEVQGEEVAGVVVDDGDRVPPAVTGDVEEVLEFVDAVDLLVADLNASAVGEDGDALVPPDGVLLS